MQYFVDNYKKDWILYYQSNLLRLSYKRKIKIREPKLFRFNSYLYNEIKNDTFSKRGTVKGLNTTIYDKLIEHILQNQDKFFRIAYCYVYQKEVAMDIVQNAICKALENYPGLRNENAIKTWFYRILINECLTYLRKSKREILCEPGEIKEDIYYEEAYEAKAEVYQLVCNLPEEMKSIILLHYFEELTLKEISQALEVNLNTVKTRLYAALKRLKKNMEVEV